MRREAEKTRVVDRLVAVVTADDDFHVVIKARRRDAAQMREGADVLAHRRGEILRLDEVEILPARVAEHVAEGVNAATARVGEIQIIRGIIHLGLFTGSGFEALHRQGRRTAAERPHAFHENRVASGVTERA